MITVVMMFAAALTLMTLLIMTALLNDHFRQSLILVNIDVSFMQTLLIQIMKNYS